MLGFRRVVGTLYGRLYKLYTGAALLWLCTTPGFLNIQRPLNLGTSYEARRFEIAASITPGYMTQLSVEPRGGTEV